MACGRGRHWNSDRREHRAVGSDGAHCSLRQDSREHGDEQEKENEAECTQCGVYPISRGTAHGRIKGQAEGRKKQDSHADEEPSVPASKFGVLDIPDEREHAERENEDRRYAKGHEQASTQEVLCSDAMNGRKQEGGADDESWIH